VCLGSSRTRFSLPTAWGAAGARTLGWDPAGQLTSCSDGSGSASFKYDPFGRRIEATGNGQTTYE